MIGIWRWKSWMALAALTCMSGGADAEKPDAARAVAVTTAEVYHAKQRPGYTCWTVLWPGVSGDIHLAFAEKRRAPNPTWEPVPLDFWEAMGLPCNYHVSFCNGARDIVTELVVLCSHDNGVTWVETGRSPSRVINAFAWAGLPDGRIIRAISDDYVAFAADVPPRLWVETSADGGTTWKLASVVLEGYQTYSYRLKRLRDGALVLVAPYSNAFGPGRTRASRHTVRPYVHQQLEGTVGVFLSTDQGQSWSGPFTAFPGILAWEPDFVELDTGDLLLVNSDVQDGPPMRQYLHRQGNRLIPGPVFDIIAGRAPECLVLTASGLLVGAVRNGVYVCSNDEGATWCTIAGLPKCGYQPYMIELADKRLLCTWHVGGDNFFGELDQSIGSTAFRLEADLPTPTKLELTRDLAPSGERYGNIYTATLTADGKPLAGRTVRFAFHKRYTPAYDAAADPRIAGTQSTAVTDSEGKAQLNLSELDAETNIHLSYRVAAWFEPETDSGLAPCRSSVYLAYARTMTRTQLGR